LGMLSELSIKNFAIIDNLSIHFQEGLTVLTGETGAGKSIIIDAVNLLSGGRGSVDYIRHGANKAELNGLFNLEENMIQVINLADINSQYDTYQIMSSHANINILDTFNSDDILKIKKEYDEVYKLISQYKQEYNQLTINEQETAQRLDLYLFQANELKEANL